MMDLLKNTAPTSNPESIAELKKSFPPSSRPASLEALANAPTVPEKIFQLSNFLNGWVNYSQKQKQAIEKYIYKEALRTNSAALEKSLRAAIENNTRQAVLPIPTLRARRGMPPLQINTNLPIQRSPPRIKPPRINTTNLPIGRGPRAPTTTTVRQPDKSQITAANIIPGKRKRRR